VGGSGARPIRCSKAQSVRRANGSALQNQLSTRYPALTSGPIAEGSLEDVFELQDEVAISVAGVIEPALQAAERRHSANRPS